MKKVFAVEINTGHNFSVWACLCLAAGGRGGDLWRRALESRGDASERTDAVKSHLTANQRGMLHDTELF